MPTTADDAAAVRDADAANPPAEAQTEGAELATDKEAPSPVLDDEAGNLDPDHPAVMAAIERATQALLAKRTELLAEVKEERSVWRQAQGQLQALAARVDALETERADLAGRLADEEAAREFAVAKAKEGLRKVRADGDKSARLAALDALERATAEGQERVAAIERAARERTERANRQVSALIAENAVLAALHAADVKADLFGAAQALIGRRVTVEDAADGMRAVVDGKPVADFVREWSETPGGSELRPRQTVGRRWRGRALTLSRREGSRGICGQSLGADDMESDPTGADPPNRSRSGDAASAGSGCGVILSGYRA